MEDWASGYVSDIGYTYGYYPELNPNRARLALLSQGIAAPKHFSTACELGYGQGISINLHAACSDTRWWGTDFNPAQASFALELASHCHQKVHLFDQSFSEFSSRSDLPEFDFIGLHGIWSWISSENRAVIVNFVRRKLAVGGVLYLSYNTQPGWATFAPVRHLLTEHATLMGTTAEGTVGRVNNAFEFADKLFQMNPLFSRVNPSVVDRMERLKTQSRHYLAHEYFNRDWHPLHFSTTANLLETAKLQYACSANFVDHIDAVNLTSEQQGFIREIKDINFRETVRDFLTNQQFRRDYWIKGRRALSLTEQTQALRCQMVTLVADPSTISFKLQGALGEASLSNEVYEPILSVLSAKQVMSIGEIERAVSGSGITFPQTVQAVLALCGKGDLCPATDQAPNVSSTSINSRLMHCSLNGGDMNFLGSPLTSGGVVVTRFQQMFLLALNSGLKDPRHIAKFVWSSIEPLGQRILKNGKALISVDENLNELEEQARSFLATRISRLEALGVVSIP